MSRTIMTIVSSFGNLTVYISKKLGFSVLYCSCSCEGFKKTLRLIVLEKTLFNRFNCCDVKIVRELDQKIDFNHTNPHE